jgi:hypothetical protein
VCLSLLALGVYQRGYHTLLTELGCNSSMVSLRHPVQAAMAHQARGAGISLSLPHILVLETPWRPLMVNRSQLGSCSWSSLAGPRMCFAPFAGTEHILLDSEHTSSAGSPVALHT